MGILGTQMVILAVKTQAPQSSSLLYYIVLFCYVLYFTVLYSITLYYTYCITLDHIMRYYHIMRLTHPWHLQSTGVTDGSFGIGRGG